MNMSVVIYDIASGMKKKKKNQTCQRTYFDLRFLFILEKKKKETYVMSKKID
jgi:hypothetical protein